MATAKSGGPPTTLVAREQNGGGIAVDATYIYWSDSQLGVISKVLRSGGTPVELASGLRCNGLALDSDYVYAATEDSHDYAIVKVSLNGGGAVQTLISGHGYVRSTIVSGQFLYWAMQGQGGIQKIPISGGRAISLANASGSPGEPALHGGELFWYDDEGLKKVGIAGGEPTLLAPQVRGPSLVSIAVDEQHVYFLDSVLKRVPIGGGTAEVVVVGDAFGLALALDDRYAYWLGGREATVLKFRK